MSTTIPSKTLYRQFLKAIEAWPVDLNRPHLSFPNTMRTQVELKYRQPETLQFGRIPIPLWTDRQAETILQSLHDLVDNKHKLRFPLSKKTLEPASNPAYYKKLLGSLEESRATSIRRFIIDFFRWR